MAKTPRISVPVTEEQRHELLGLLYELQAPHRRGTPLAVSQRIKIYGFITQLAMERAAQIRDEIQPPKGKKR